VAPSPPAPPVAAPLNTLRPLMLIVPAEAKKTRYKPSPLTVELPEPSPVIVTDSVIAGSALSNVMVPAAAASKVIVLAPPSALASMIACRSDPAPESAVLVTVNCAPAVEAQSAANAKTQIHVIRMLYLPLNQMKPRTYVNRRRTVKKTRRDSPRGKKSPPSCLLPTRYAAQSLRRTLAWNLDLC
jgi:hypothetical protein